MCFCSQVTWHFRDRPIRESSDEYEFQHLGNKYALIVKKPTTTDAGTYYCEAENPHGAVRSECHLVIKGICIIILINVRLSINDRFLQSMMKAFSRLYTDILLNVCTALTLYKQCNEKDTLQLLKDSHEISKQLQLSC